MVYRHIGVKSVIEGLEIKETIVKYLDSITVKKKDDHVPREIYLVVDVFRF